MIIGGASSAELLFWGIFLCLCACAASWLLIRLIRWHWRIYGEHERKTGQASYRRDLPLLLTGYALVSAVVAGTAVGGALDLLLFTARHKPHIALSHPMLGRALARMAHEGDLKRELERGIEKDDLDLMRASLTLGADASNASEGRSYLNMAHSEPARRVLLDHGAPVDGLPNQAPPLREAWHDDDLVLFRELLGKGANPNLAITAGNGNLLTLTIFNYDDPERWLQPLLAHGADLNLVGRNGLTVLDELVLADTRSDWGQRLRELGASHGILLDRGDPLPEDHPLREHVLRWLDARLAPSWPKDADRWQLAEAWQSGHPLLPASAEVVRLEGRFASDQALVELHFQSELTGAMKTVVALRRQQAERPGVEGEGQGVWRISGYWTDNRP